MQWGLLGGDTDDGVGATLPEGPAHLPHVDPAAVALPTSDTVRRLRNRMSEYIFAFKGVL